jgi:carbamoylphosphate synthase large subunit
MKIIISDIENRKSFDIVNIARLHFTKKNIIHAGNEKNLLLNSIYPGLVLLRTGSFDHFEEDLKKILSNEQQQTIVYLAVEESTTILFYQFRKKHPEYAATLISLLPPEESFNISRDKYLLNLFCAKHQITAPAIIDYSTLDDFMKRFVPLIYKPKQGSGSNGIQFIRTPEDLMALKPEEGFFLQEFVGNGLNVEGGFYLMDKGTLVSFYSHQRIRTYPPEGGVSVYSKTVDNTKIRDIGAKLLKALDWSGWAMIEFLYDEKANDYSVIEINPRAWGSILLSEFNNAGFLQKYVALAAGQVVQQSAINYDTFIRWMFPWDILLFVKKKGKIKKFWKLERKKTCYIGFTYAGKFKSLLFILYSVFSIKHLKKILKG